jgi:Protein of unknown function (DUF2764)
MTNYYFLGTLLPELQIGTPPEIGFDEFQNLLKDNLTSSDLAKTRIIRRYFDIQNLRAYWKGDPLDPFGNLEEHTLEEIFIAQTGLPSYVYEYMDKYESVEDRIHHFTSLLIAFFNHELKNASGFLKEYFIMERETRLVFLAFRAKKLGRDVLAELQDENPEDPLVAQIIAQKDAPAFEPPEKYQELKPIFEKYHDKPLDLLQALYEYRFHTIDEILGFDTFSIDRILGYMVKLILAEKWMELDKEKGIAIVDTILKETT